jgi:hypothetical protein
MDDIVGTATPGTDTKKRRASSTAAGKPAYYFTTAIY